MTYQQENSHQGRGQGGLSIVRTITHLYQPSVDEKLHEEGMGRVGAPVGIQQRAVHSWGLESQRDADVGDVGDFKLQEGVTGVEHVGIACTRSSTSVG